MTNKKYELTDEILDGTTLHRIKALINFSYIKAGDLGGYIEKEDNLSQKGNAWVSGNAMIYGNAQVSDNAQVYGNAQVSGNASIKSNNDYCVFQSFGSGNRTTTAYRTESDIRVHCGCFNGTLKEFKKRIISTHGHNEYAKQYLLMIKLIQAKFFC